MLADVVCIVLGTIWVELWGFTLDTRVIAIQSISRVAGNAKQLSCIEGLAVGVGLVAISLLVEVVSE